VTLHRFLPTEHCGAELIENDLSFAVIILKTGENTLVQQWWRYIGYAIILFQTFKKIMHRYDRAHSAKTFSKSVKQDQSKGQMAFALALFY